MNFKKCTTYMVGKDVFLDQVMTEIPNNAFVNKGRCGIGGTTLEIDNKQRCSIIVVPTRGILNDKIKTHKELFIVDGDVKWEVVKDQLLLNVQAQKIMTTPESFPKIIRAALWLKKDQEVFKTWFLLCDEAHTFVSEAYRKGIVRPFDYFWAFDHKAIISATPYFFSDERFYDLSYHEIRFTENLGVINLFDCLSPLGTLCELLRDRQGNDEHLHIFVNSVTEITYIIKAAQIEVCNIFCADDKDKANMQKLGDLKRHYVAQPDESNFKHINFYTCKYFEGWDMKDPKAVIVLYTDIHKLHTMVPVAMKLKQAAGRWRNIPKREEPLEIIHITNHRNIQAKPRSLESFKVDYASEAKKRIEQFNELIYLLSRKGRKPRPCPILEQFADYERKTMRPILKPLKLDQVVNEAYSNETYNNIDLIRQEWEKAYFDVIVCRTTTRLETKTHMTRKSKANKLKEDYQALKTRQTDVKSLLTIGLSLDDKIKKSNPLACKAAELLSPETMERLKYNVKKVEREVIIASNARADVKLYKLLALAFIVGKEYSMITITNALNDMYLTLNIRDPRTGDVQKAKATDLTNYRWFDVDHCKIKDSKGKFSIHAFRIIRAHFHVSLAAA